MAFLFACFQSRSIIDLYLPMARSKIIWHHLPCMIGLVTGLFFFSLQITSPDFSRIPGDLGDARFNNYVLEHAHLYFTGEVKEFWSAPFIYPEKNIIAYSDNFLGTAPFYSLFRSAGSDPQLAFQYWFILMTILNYLACYILLYYLFKNPYAAALGAMVFAFSIALQSQISHAQAFPRFAIPLCLMSAVHYLKTLNPRFFFLSLLAIVYQFYCGIYLGFLLLITMIFFFLLSFIYRYGLYKEKLKIKKWWLWMFCALLVNGFLLSLLMSHYMSRANDFTLYPYWEVVNSLPTIRSFFYAHYGSYLWKFLENTGNQYEAYWDHQIFPGAIALLSFVAFVFLTLKRGLLKKNRVVENRHTALPILFFTVLSLFVFFLRFQDYSLYRLIFFLPGFNSMRALQRVINVELVFFAIALAFVGNSIFTQNRTRNMIVFILGLGMIYLDNFIHYDAIDAYKKNVSAERLEKLDEKLAGLKKGSIISYEPDTFLGPVIYYQIDAMLAAQKRGLKCLNGYTSNPPDYYSYYWLKPEQKTRRIWLTIKSVPESDVYVIK